MPLLPSRVWLDAARAVAGAATLSEAFNRALTLICDSLLAHGLLLQRTASGWTLLASYVAEARAALWRSRIEALGESSDILVRLQDGGDTATAIRVRTAGPPLIVLVLDGDWDASRESLIALQALGFALRAARQRDALTIGRRFFVQLYRSARLWSPSHDVEGMADRIVHATVHTLRASRVSLALNEPSSPHLVLAATHGLPEWLRGEPLPAEGGLIGRVVKMRRPLLVCNSREKRIGEGNVERYRTGSFVVAPILAGGEAIGALCATDKFDGADFDRRDYVALRLIGASVGSALLYARTAAERDRVKQMAALDPVSGLHNRQYLDSRLQQEVDRTTREGTTVALMIADIDEFKHINDTVGHQHGDLMLRGVGDIIRSAVRSIDVCARYGGDEFVVVMPNTDAQSAEACAQRIKALAAERAPSQGGRNAITLSVGIAVSTAEDDAESLFGRADRALYRAKAAGKNRIQVDAAPAARVESSAFDRASTAAHEPTRAPGRAVFGEHAATSHVSNTDAEDLIEQVRSLVGPKNLVIYLPTPDGRHFRVAAVHHAVPSTPASDVRIVLRRARESQRIETLGEVRFADDPQGPTGRVDKAVGIAAIPLLRSGTVAAVVGIYDSPGLTVHKRALDAVQALRLPRERAAPVVVSTASTPVRALSPAANAPTLLERPWAEAIAARELARARREQRQLSIVLFEMAQQPRSGGGGDTLALVVEAFVKAVRESDLPVRWDAHELLLILPGLPASSARAVAERVRAAMHAGGRHTVLVAGGVAEADLSVPEFGEVVARARERVAMAVNRGHNRVH